MYFTYSVISIHDQCLFTAFEYSFHQYNVTEIKPQAKIHPQFGLLTLKKRQFLGGAAPQTRCFITLNFLALPPL